MPHFQGHNNAITQKLLRHALDEAISDLGLQVAKTIIWHLQTRGAISGSYGTFDLDRVYAGLQEILGPGTELVMQRIYQNFSRNYAMNTILAFEKEHDSDSYLEKINLLAKKMEEEVEN